MKEVKFGKVESYINGIINSGKGVFMALIDPDKQSPEEAAKLAKVMEQGGADVIMLGGSIGAQGEIVDRTAELIKKSVKIPLHVFPGNIGNVTKHADSLYYMSLLNSKNPYWISGAQTLAATTIKRYGIEPIPTAYLIFEPGQTAGWVGEAHLLPRNKPDLAVAHSLAAQYMGMRFVVMDAGSGAPEHIPLEIVSAVRKYVDVNIVVGGGIKTPEQARRLVEAGANCLQIGTILEDNNEQTLKRVREFARAIHME